MKILIVAGGTGGHLFPAIRLAEEIMSKQIGKLRFITSCRNQDRIILEDKNIKFQTLPIIGLQSKKVLPLLNFIVRLLAGTVKSALLLLRFRPSVVIGFGGYVSGPVVLLASLFRIKTVIHEQNVYPGKTNRVLANFVDKIAVSFPETIRYLEKFESKIIISGNPLRRELKRSQRKIGLRPYLILAMGGSQGAHILNKIIPEAVGLMDNGIKNTLEIIHISGYNDKDLVEKAYQDRGVKSRVFSFILDLDKFYNECDFVISRSGATTVSELLYLAKPSILIPYPYGNGHQKLNAKVLEDRGLALLFEEHELTAQDLANAMVKLMDRNVLNSMAERVKDTESKDACSILIGEIIRVESRE